MKRLLTMLTLGTCVVCGAQTSPVQDKYLETIKVAENIYVFKPKIDWAHSNAVAIIAPEGVFIIDTFLQQNYAEEAVRRLRRITKLPVVYVFNTHSHNDHTFGNSVFKRAFPSSRIIVQAGAVAPMNARVKTDMAAQPVQIASDIARTKREIANGKADDGTPITGSMVAYWALQLREAEEYQKQYQPEPYFSPDITFADSLTIRWGDVTLQMLHMTEDGHSRSDAILWIPEQRVLVAGDIVVGPTPYYSLVGITPALRRLIAMNPAIIIPGHGVVQHDLSYMQLLERGIASYQRVADSAAAAGVPRQQAQEQIVLSDIDRAFTGDDAMKKFAYHSFVFNTIFARAYNPAIPPNSPPLAAGSRSLLRLDSLSAYELQNVKVSVVPYRGRRALKVVPSIGSASAGWQGATEAMAMVLGSDFRNGVIEAEVSGAPKAGAREGSRGFVGIAFRSKLNGSAFETFYLRPTNGRTDDQLRRNHAVQYQAFPNFQWDRLREQMPGVYEAYADIEPGAWTSIKIVVNGATARFFVNGATQPTLVVNDLKLGDSQGLLALWIGQDTEAYFSKLVVTPTP